MQTSYDLWAFSKELVDHLSPILLPRWNLIDKFRDTEKFATVCDDVGGENIYERK